MNMTPYERRPVFPLAIKDNETSHLIHFQFLDLQFITAIVQNWNTFQRSDNLSQRNSCNFKIRRSKLPIQSLREQLDSRRFLAQFSFDVTHEPKPEWFMVQFIKQQMLLMCCFLTNWPPEIFPSQKNYKRREHYLGSLQNVSLSVTNWYVIISQSFDCDNITTYHDRRSTHEHRFYQFASEQPESDESKQDYFKSKQ